MSSIKHPNRIHLPLQILKVPHQRDKLVKHLLVTVFTAHCAPFRTLGLTSSSGKYCHYSAGNAKDLRSTPKILQHQATIQSFVPEEWMSSVTMDAVTAADSAGP